LSGGIVFQWHFYTGSITINRSSLINT